MVLQTLGRIGVGVETGLASNPETWKPPSLRLRVSARVKTQKPNQPKSLRVLSVLLFNKNSEPSSRFHPVNPVLKTSAQKTDLLLAQRRRGQISPNPFVSLASFCSKNPEPSSRSHPVNPVNPIQKFISPKPLRVLSVLLFKKTQSPHPNPLLLILSEKMISVFCGHIGRESR